MQLMINVYHHYNTPFTRSKNFLDRGLDCNLDCDPDTFAPCKLGYNTYQTTVSFKFLTVK